MATNYGPTTKSYIAGLKLEILGLDKNVKTFDASKALIEAELVTAEKNLKVEEKEAADLAAASE
jgi:hypothetical protein